MVVVSRRRSFSYWTAAIGDIKCCCDSQVASARSFAMAGRHPWIEGCCHFCRAFLCFGMPRSFYLLVGTGSRSTAEARTCSSKVLFGHLISQVGWLDVPSLLELAACSGADLIVPYGGLILQFLLARLVHACMHAQDLAEVASHRTYAQPKYVSRRTDWACGFSWRKASCRKQFLCWSQRRSRFHQRAFTALLQGRAQNNLEVKLLHQRWMIPAGPQLRTRYMLTGSASV